MENIIIFLFLLIILLVIRKRMINYSNIKEIKNNDIFYINEDTIEEMYNINFWNLSEEEILNKDEINEFNNEINNPRYHLFELNDEVLYGLVVKNSELRKHPNYEKSDEIIDKNLLTIVDYGSGVLILDSTEEWYYVRTKYYEGWILKNNVGLTTKEEMDKYINCKKYVRIVANKILIDNLVALNMGVKVPIISSNNKYYKLLFIDLDNNGNIEYVERYVLFNDYMVDGDLKLNQYNIIKQGLKMMNEPYIWGNTDCSSFIQRIFMCFGIYLPRDSEYQKLIQKNKFDIKNIVSGDIIFSPGHVMLYLGEYNNKKFIIHSLYGKVKLYKRVAITLIDNYVPIITNYLRF